MRAWVVPPGSTGIADLRRVDRPDPQPGSGQVLVRVRAASLNYRDQLVASGTYFGGPNTRDLVPLSDAAGEVAAVGAGVSRLGVGDRVAGTFFQRPPDGAPGAPPLALGSPLDGTLADSIVLYEDGLVVIPADLSYEEAACLPCAAVTAWHALFRAGRPVHAGDTVLVLGTGGVSIFALQLARSAGARVIATSSTDEKLERVIALGASDAINYRRTPDWEKEVLRLSGGRGVDCVVEVGGGGTFARSLQALGRGGKVCLIGFVAGRDGDTSPYPLMYKAGSLHGIFVGDREMFEEMNRAIAVNHLKPVIDRVFPFEEAGHAFVHHASGKFVGKVVIQM
jgi:NADPH:quinone reductase-like Zn-dependent oxidoreductase